jgi:hypothetical protein
MSQDTNTPTTPEIPANAIHPEPIEPISNETGVPVNEIDGAGGVVDAPKPTSIQELVASIDLSNVTTHEIVVDLIGGIQQLAIRGQIALGLLERLNVAETDETPAAPEVTKSEA